VLLVWDIFDKEDVIPVARKIVERFHEPIIIGGLEINLTVSIGIALYPENGTEINPLIKKSDDCMYYVKGIGKDRYMLYDKMPKL
jgi:GGDEF domain-containing protein